MPSRKDIRAALEQTPIEHILTADVSRQLTAKQRKFAHEVAKGATKADAYRAAYDVTSAASTRNDPYRIAADPRIRREIEAYSLALEAEKHRTPAALRSLVIQTLTQVLIDPDAKPSVRINAAKILGTVTEVAAFTERKETRVITSSDDARSKFISEIRAMMTSDATDATLLDADSLLRELAGPDATDAADASPGDMREGDGADPPLPDPPADAGGVPPL